MAASGTGCLVFIDDTDRRMYSDVYRVILCSDSAKCCRTDQPQRHSVDGYGFKAICKSNLEFLKANKWDFFNDQIRRLISTQYSMLSSY